MHSGGLTVIVKKRFLLSADGKATWEQWVLSGYCFVNAFFSRQMMIKRKPGRRRFVAHLGVRKQSHISRRHQ